jgi:SHS2 domain-containing protein
MPYEYLEEVATADIAFRAGHPALEGVFVAAAATMNVMVEELASIRPVVEREIMRESTSLERLLFDFLQRFNPLQWTGAAFRLFVVQRLS